MFLDPGCFDGKMDFYGEEVTGIRMCWLQHGIDEALEEKKTKSELKDDVWKDDAKRRLHVQLAAAARTIHAAAAGKVFRRAFRPKPNVIPRDLIYSIPIYTRCKRLHIFRLPHHRSPHLNTASLSIPSSPPQLSPAWSPSFFHVRHRHHTTSAAPTITTLLFHHPTPPYNPRYPSPPLTTVAIMEKRLPYMATAAISKPPPPACHHHHVTFTTPLKSPSSSTIGCPTKIATTPPRLLPLTHHQPTAAVTAAAFSFFLLDLVFEGVCFCVLTAREGVFVSAVNQPNRAFGFAFNTQTGVFGSAVKGRLVRQLTPEPGCLVLQSWGRLDLGLTSTWGAFGLLANSP
ncbi:hypothetical protein Tco_0581209 [Tanacetum coccineum]